MDSSSDIPPTKIFKNLEDNSSLLGDGGANGPVEIPLVALDPNDPLGNRKRLAAAMKAQGREPQRKATGRQASERDFPRH